MAEHQEEPLLELVHKDHMDLVNFEDSFFPLGLATETCRVGERYVGMSVKELRSMRNSVVIALGDFKSHEPAHALDALLHYLNAAWDWAQKNPGKVEP